MDRTMKFQLFSDSYPVLITKIRKRIYKKSKRKGNLYKNKYFLKNIADRHDRQNNL